MLNTKLRFFLYFVRTHLDLVKFLSKLCEIKKLTLKKNSSNYEKYEYGHLGSWYIKSTRYKRLLY